MKKLTCAYTDGMAEFSHLAKSKLQKQDKLVKEVVDINARYDAQAKDLRARLKQKERDVFRLEKCLSTWKALTLLFLLLAVAFFHFARPSVCTSSLTYHDNNQ